MNLQIKYDSLLNVKQNPVPYPVTGKTEYKYPKWLVLLAIIGAFSVGFTIYKLYIRFK